MLHIFNFDQFRSEWIIPSIPISGHADFEFKNIIFYFNQFDELDEWNYPLVQYAVPNIQIGLFIWK